MFEANDEQFVEAVVRPEPKGVQTAGVGAVKNMLGSATVAAYKRKPLEPKVIQILQRKTRHRESKEVEKK